MKKPEEKDNADEGGATPSKASIRQGLCELDAACCRLVNYKNSAVVMKTVDGNDKADSAGKLAIQELGSRLALALKKECGIQAEGGVYGALQDDFWFFSFGEDVNVSWGKDVNLMLAEKEISDALLKLHCLLVPEQDENDFYIVSTKDRGRTLFAKRDLPAHHLISTYHGYIRHMDEGSNEHYNATIAHCTPSGSLTVDPTCDSEDVVLEFSRCFANRVNEPPPGLITNVKWELRRMKAPRLWTSCSVAKDEELFLYYGEGYAAVRDYEIEPGLVYKEFGDVEDE